MQPRQVLGTSLAAVGLITVTACASPRDSAASVAGLTPTGGAKASQSAHGGTASPGTGSTAHAGGQLPAPLGACPSSADAILPINGCSVVLRPAAKSVFAFPSLYKGASIFELVHISGDAIRIDDNTVETGTRRLSVTAIRPGASSVTVSAAGPGNAPGALWTFRVIVR